MPEQTINATDGRDRDIAEIVRKVARERKGVRVVLGESGSVLVLPLENLPPLPELEGSVPEGWKDAIYGQ
jgi:hypothetical protein